MEKNDEAKIAMLQVVHKAGTTHCHLMTSDGRIIAWFSDGRDARLAAAFLPVLHQLQQEDEELVCQAQIVEDIENSKLWPWVAAASAILHEAGMSAKEIGWIIHGWDIEKGLRRRGIEPLANSQGRAAELIERMKKD